MLCQTSTPNQGAANFLLSPKAAALSLSDFNCLLCSLSNTTVKMQKPELHAAPKICTSML